MASVGRGLLGDAEPLTTAVGLCEGGSANSLHSLPGLLPLERKFSECSDVTLLIYCCVFSASDGARQTEEAR